MTTKIAISGVLGRMGRTLVEATLARQDCQLSAGTERASNEMVGKTLSSVTGWPSEVVITDRLADADFDVLIDFSTVENTLANLDYCAAHHKKMVIGTTGFSAKQIETITRAGDSTALVFSPNMSIGVNTTFALLAQAAKTLAGKDYDVEILEMHHRYKVDAPSGTALKMGEIIAKNSGLDPQKSKVFCRQGQCGARTNGEIGYQTLRGGDVVGEHTAMFITQGERIEITHKSTSRMTYAKGATQAAVWLANKEYGCFNMQDVLENV